MRVNLLDELVADCMGMVAALGWFNANGLGFSYDDLASAAVGPRGQAAILALLLLAFGLKLPVVPLHGWQWAFTVAGVLPLLASGLAYAFARPVGRDALA